MARALSGLRRAPQAEGRAAAFQLQPDPAAESAFRLLGIPVTITNRIPADGGVGDNEPSIVLADFSQIAVARDLSPSLRVLSERYADFDQMAIRVVARYDTAPLNPPAVVVLRGITP